MSEEKSEGNFSNQQESDAEVAQKQQRTDDKHINKATQEFDVNAHGHKPTQIAHLSDEMGDNSNVYKTEDTNAGNVIEEQISYETELGGLVDSTNSETKAELSVGNTMSHTHKNETELDSKHTDSECQELSKSTPNEINVEETRESDGIASDRDNLSSCEYKEISSDDAEDDHEEELTEKADVDSSTSSPSQISPEHYYGNNNQQQYDYDNAEGDNEEDNADINPERPDSLSLPRPLQYLEKQKYLKHHKRGRSDTSLASDVSRSSSTDALIEDASKTPLSSKGTVTKDGDMIAFVAEGLNDLIKLSSPLSQTDSSVSSSLRSPGEKSVSSVSSSTSAWSDVTSSASEWSRDYSRMSRNRVEKPPGTQSPSILTASPDDIPPVDPRAVMDLEMHAVRVAGSVDHMMGTLNNNLHKMSALSFHCLDAHKDAVDSTCDSVDSSIKCMYALMAKCEELSKTMQPVYTLHTQVKEIERLLDLFEGQIAKEEK